MDKSLNKWKNIKIKKINMIQIIKNKKTKILMKMWNNKKNNKMKY